MPPPRTEQWAPDDTIYALSSGRPPAGIAIIRISGRRAGNVLAAVAGKMPTPRRASLRTIRSRSGEPLDDAMVLWLPGPGSATGEDVAELHLHGGRAIVDAVLRELASLDLRLAEPGEFTRRALLNGRLSLSEAEGLADLLAAETETQRREALRRADGALGHLLDEWTNRLIGIAASLEMSIDYDGEEEAGVLQMDEVRSDIGELLADMAGALAVPPAERLRDGIRVAIVGKPNAGKSTLLNMLIGRDAAIVTPIAGTTRDTIEAHVAIGGLPFLLIDTAGIRSADDPVEQVGIERARRAAEMADIVLSLDAETDTVASIAIGAKADIEQPRSGSMPISGVTGSGILELTDALVEAGKKLLPGESDVALDRRYRDAIEQIRSELIEARKTFDELLAAEHVSRARSVLDRLTGRAGLDDVLDELFGRFCLGK